MTYPEQRLASRESIAANYLSLLQSLAAEVNGAISAIERNCLSEFQDHVARQEILCLEVHELMRALTLDTHSPQLLNGAVLDAELAPRVADALRTLSQLNRSYASLLRHSGESVMLLSAVCQSFRGRLQSIGLEQAGQQTLSCEV